MMSKARIIAAAQHNAWKRFDAAMKEFSGHLVIRQAEIPAREAGVEKVRVTIHHAYEHEAPDPHTPMLVIECDRDPYHAGVERPRIRLTEAEAVDLGRFIRSHFGE